MRLLDLRNVGKATLKDLEILKVESVEALALSDLNRFISKT